VKLEGSGKIGERYVGIVGVRDPYTIANIDLVMAWARQQVAERFGEAGYELHFTVCGRDGILGDREPLKVMPAHKLGIVVQEVAPTKVVAEEVCMIATRQMFYARLPQVKGTAGGLAFLLDEVMRASPAYRWTLNHTCGSTIRSNSFRPSSPRRKHDGLCGAQVLCSFFIPRI
jgi:hypothetical protein